MLSPITRKMITENNNSESLYSKTDNKATLNNVDDKRKLLIKLRRDRKTNTKKTIKRLSINNFSKSISKTLIKKGVSQLLDLCYNERQELNKFLSENNAVVNDIFAYNERFILVNISFINDIDNREVATNE